MKSVRHIEGETIGAVVHVFERCGLGKAPFRFDGFEVKLHQVPGEVARAGSCCDYCGANIANVFWIKGSDGSRFKVGSDCVAKTGDAGLLKIINAKVAEHKRQLADARADAKIAEAAASLAAKRDRLQGKPHPNAVMAARGSTLLDYVQWMLKNAGRSGKLRAVKIIMEEVSS